jgi:hypothetical protein
LLNVDDESYDNDVEMVDQLEQEYNPNDLDPPVVVPVAISDSSSDEGSVEDEENKEDRGTRYVNDFAGAGLPHAERSQTNFELHFAQQGKAGDAPWTPFESEDEWELARWLMSSGVSQKQINGFLKLNKVNILAIRSSSMLNL